MTLFIRELQKLLALTRSDPKSLMAGVIAPTVVLLIFAITFGNFAALTLAVVDEDAGPLGAELTDSVFSQTSPLGGQYFEAVPLASPEAHAEYEAGRVNGILHIPEDFSAQLQAGEPGQIDYHFLNYNTDMAKNLRLYLDEGILDFYSEHLPGMDLQVEQRMAVDAQLDWFAIIAVGILLLGAGGSRAQRHEQRQHRRHHHSRQQPENDPAGSGFRHTGELHFFVSTQAKQKRCNPTSKLLHSRNMSRCQGQAYPTPGRTHQNLPL